MEQPEELALKGKSVLKAQRGKLVGKAQRGKLV